MFKRKHRLQCFNCWWLKTHFNQGFIGFPSGGPFDLMSRRMLSANNDVIAHRIIKEIEVFPVERDDAPVQKKWEHSQNYINADCTVYFLLVSLSMFMYCICRICPTTIEKKSNMFYITVRNHGIVAVVSLIIYDYNFKLNVALQYR